jgi:hypothetical protein
MYARIVIEQDKALPHNGFIVSLFDTKNIGLPTVPLDAFEVRGSPWPAHAV